MERPPRVWIRARVRRADEGVRENFGLDFVCLDFDWDQALHLESDVGRQMGRRGGCNEGKRGGRQSPGRANRFVRGRR